MNNQDFKGRSFVTSRSVDVVQVDHVFFACDVAMLLVSISIED